MGVDSVMVQAPYSIYVVIDLILLEGLALFPDLNFIENVWGWLARKIYGEGKQFEDKIGLLKQYQPVN